MAEEIRLEVEDGILRYKGSRMWILNPYAIAELQKEMRRIIGPAHKTILFNGARKGAIRFVEEMLSSSTLARTVKRFGWGQRRIAEEICKVATRLGFGEMSVVSYDEKEDRWIIRVINSPVPEALESDTPICELTRGVIAGALEVITGKSYKVREIKCLAIGDEFCEFEATRK